MNIKIITTEKKLSKSIINQMPILKSDLLKKSEILGLLRNVLKGMFLAILLKYCDEYYVFPGNYKEFESCKIRAFYNKSTFYKFHGIMSFLLTIIRV